MQKTIYSREQRRWARLLQDLRTEAGLTQAQLARRLRRPQSFVSKLEAGQRRIDVVELEAMARAFGLSLSAVVGRYERAGRRR
jgi:transcriptional regulator with XRE-family HTH domain